MAAMQRVQEVAARAASEVAQAADSLQQRPAEPAAPNEEGYYEWEEWCQSELQQERQQGRATRRRHAESRSAHRESEEPLSQSVQAVAEFPTQSVLGPAAPAPAATPPDAAPPPDRYSLEELRQRNAGDAASGLTCDGCHNFVSNCVCSGGPVNSRLVGQGCNSPTPEPTPPTMQERAQAQLAAGSVHPLSAEDRALLERVARGEQTDSLQTWPTLPPRSPFQPKNIE